MKAKGVILHKSQPTPCYTMNLYHAILAITILGGTSATKPCPSHDKKCKQNMTEILSEYMNVDLGGLGRERSDETYMQDDVNESKNENDHVDVNARGDEGVASEYLWDNVEKLDAGKVDHGRDLDAQHDKMLDAKLNAILSQHRALEDKLREENEDLKAKLAAERERKLREENEDLKAKLAEKERKHSRFDADTITWYMNVGFNVWQAINIIRKVTPPAVAPAVAPAANIVCQTVVNQVGGKTTDTVFCDKLAYSVEFMLNTDVPGMVEADE